MNLTSRIKVKRHIGIAPSDTSKDNVLDTIIEGVSAFIETYTNRIYAFAQYTEVLDGTSRDEIFLAEYPVRDVLSLTINGTEIDLDQEEEDETFILDTSTGGVYRQNGFGSGRKAVRITYTAGFDSPDDPEESGDESGDAGDELPNAIEAAAIRLSARVYERRTAEGVSSASPGSFSVNYKDAIDSDIVEILNSYKKRRI